MLTIGTYNLHFKLKPVQVRQDLDRLLKTDVEVLGMQEMGKNARVPQLELLCVSHDWEYTRPDDIGSQKQTPIAWNNRIWEAVQTGSHRINDEAYAEPGAGGAFIETKWATWVILRRRNDGLKIAVINWHAPGSVENPLLVRRRAVLVECVQSVKALIKDLKPEVMAVFVTGDMNVNWRKGKVRKTKGFPVMGFENVGLRANWSWFPKPDIGTHVKQGVLRYLDGGKRIIDYVFSTHKPVQNSILKGYASDHRPVVARYRL